MWSVKESGSDPRRLAKEFIKKSPRDGVVFVQSPLEGIETLRFSAVAECGNETPLLLGLTAAFSASEGIRKDTGIISWVRWPASVTIDGNVVAVSQASVTQTAGRAWVQLDFLVNLLRNRLRGTTSLEDELGVEVDSRLLLEKILESLSWMHFGWTTGTEAQILRRIVSMTEMIGTRVTVRGRGRSAMATAADIDTLGRLVVRLDDGRTKELEAEDELLEP